MQRPFPCLPPSPIILHSPETLCRILKALSNHEKRFTELRKLLSTTGHILWTFSSGVYVVNSS